MSDLDERAKEVVRRAIEWWADRCPLCMDESAHLANPIVNCITDVEEMLAEAVARLLSERKA